VILNNLKSGDANRQHFALRVISYSGGGYDSRPIQKTVKANAKTVMPILLELTRSDDPGVAEQSIRIVYHVDRRDAAYVPRLLEAVSRSQHPGVYQTAAQQLLKLDTPPSNLIDVATERAQRGTYRERSTGVWMLGELAKRRSKAVSSLIELIADDSYDLPAPTPDSPKSAGRRRRRNPRQAESLREYAITRLAECGSTATEAMPLLKQLSTDEELDRRVRQAAAAALEQIESDEPPAS
jgi:HEAT repeat protein